jgi:hypothetical protein
MKPKLTVRKRKASTLSRLRKRLEQLQHAFSVASEVTRAKLVVQIRVTEELIKIELGHRVSGFNRIRVREIPAGAPGLGKRR